MGENKKVLLNALDQLQEQSSSFTTSNPPPPLPVKKEEDKSYQRPLLTDNHAGLIRTAETERLGPPARPTSSYYADIIKD